MKKLSFEQGNTNEYSWYVRVVYEPRKLNEDGEWTEPIADNFYFAHDEVEEAMEMYLNTDIQCECTIMYSRDYLEDKWEMRSIRDCVVKGEGL